jgi:hypothetical protein
MGNKMKISTWFIIIIISFNFFACDPEKGSFFDLPEYPEGYLPDIPNEPGFYVNGENKGILLFTDIVDWINKNVSNGAVYGIVLHQNISINPVTFSYPGKNVFIIIKGNAEGRTLSLSRQGSLITVGEGVTLGLSSNIELKGIPDNNRPLISIRYRGKFIMNDGIVSGNTSNGGFGSGGGIAVLTNGLFIMNGGKIINNTAIYGQNYGGGGVSNSGGNFIMNGGEISNNTFTTTSGTGSVGYGGGGVSGGLTMNGGKIINNRSLGGQGGGIFSGGTLLIINDGEISNNSSTNDGGGIYRFGGNIDVIIEGGIILGNSAGRRGGGIYCNINNNSSQFKFIKKSNGGIIYGNNAESNLQNIAGQNGHAVFINDTKFRNLTVTEYIELDSSKLAEWE